LSCFDFGYLLLTPEIRAAAGGDIVVVEVGPGLTRYSVYKLLLSYHSKYFQKALNGHLKEVDESVVQLLDVEPCIFNVFVHWMYTQRLPEWRSQEWLDISGIGGTNPNTPSVSLLTVKCCALSDQLAAASFQEAVNNMYINDRFDRKKPCPYEDIIFAFSNLPESNPMLRLMVDTQCLFWNARMDAGLEKELQSLLPQSFLLQTMLRNDEMKKLPSKSGFKRCNYHIHASDEEREECETQESN
jgi:hypothetical protein